MLKIFSSLWCTKNAIKKSKIGEDRFNRLMLFNIHRDIEITPEEVIEEFGKNHSIKLQLQYM